MKRRTKHVLFWLPRVLGILFAIFLSLFAFDIFNQGYGVRETVQGLLIHLIPVFIVVAVLVLTWRRQWIGALLFPTLALSYPVLTQGRQHWSVYLVISGPLVLLGVLFILNWIYREQLQNDK